MNLRERILQGLAFAGIFLGLPALFGGFVAQPALRRMEASKARQSAAVAAIQAIAPVVPLDAGERELLADPQAPWRRRIPWMTDDPGRLWQYHRVVTDLQRAWRQEGLTGQGIRASLEPVHGSFSLPGDLASYGVPSVEGAEPGRLDAWVLEATVEGTTRQLFQALRAVPRCEPVLEPVGLRWESAEGRRRQTLLLRNYVLVP